MAGGQDRSPEALVILPVHEVSQSLCWFGRVIECGQELIERLIAKSAFQDREANRWGYVHATTSEKTMVALEQVLPERYWVEINRSLVPFGKHLCTGVLRENHTARLRRLDHA